MRKIIHIDMDCFYAAIEMRDDPSLRGIPLAVGGHPERRGVIATANYEARRFGVRSAMASAHAMRLCPSLLIVPTKMEKYRAESQIIRTVFEEFTDQIEPLSLDEAYLDVSECDQLHGSATLIAGEIRRRIKEATGLTASAGVGPNKFIAKVASDFDKPDGLTVVPPEGVDEFVAALPIERIPGVGEVTAEKFHRLDLRTCADLRELSLSEMLRRFGSRGRRLFDLARGIDNRPVKVERIAKSVSVETTFSEDLPDVEACVARIPELFDSLTERFHRKERPPIRALFVKVKFDDFRQTTLERSEFQTPREAVFEQLMREAVARHDRAVRLLGLGVRLDADSLDQPVQLELFTRR